MYIYILYTIIVYIHMSSSHGFCQMSIVKETSIFERYTNHNGHCMVDLQVGIPPLSLYNHGY